MTISIERGPDLGEGSGDVLIVPMLAEATPGPGAEWALGELGEWTDAFMEAADFAGKPGQTLMLPGGDLAYANVLLVGLGEEVDAEGLRRAAATAAKAVSGLEVAVTTMHQLDIDGAEDCVAFGFLLGLYRFDEFRSEPKPASLTTLLLAGDGPAPDHGVIVARAVAMARDLVNRPAGDKPPAWIADWAVDTLGAARVEVEVWDADRVVDEQLGGLAAVAQGAANPARLVRCSVGPEDADKTVVLVGKGIVFDSGGLSIKTAAGMESMKTDMGGAAAVLCAVWAIAQLDLSVRVVGITPLTENMPGGAALRPGDVFIARNGKTVEVLNTDAEGRLVLADGLSLAAELEPDLIVDAATLTGAAKVALGEKIAAMMSNDDDAAATVLGAARRAGEDVWRMPLDSQYRKKLDSEVADMKNTGDRFGGSITAALMLEEFVDGIPWAHLDIAGPARSGAAEHYITKGGTGFGVRTLVAIAEDLAD